MIPILYPANETQFQTNGICRLSDIISCLVTEERNGKFEVEFQYPVTGSRYSEITEGRIIYCTYDESGDAQPFDIYRHSAPLNGVVTFNARHISYRLCNVIMRPFKATSCANFFSSIKTQSIHVNKFTFTTDRSMPGTVDFKTFISVRSALGGVEGSALDVYGPGEYKWNKFNVSFLNRRGEDLDVSIRYGKNLTELEYEYDNSGVFNAVVPYWISGENDNLVYLPEYTISSGHAVTYVEPWTDASANYMTNAAGVQLEFSTAMTAPAVLDLSSNFTEKPTVAELREAAKRYMTGNEPWVPNENLTISFVALWGTDEYAGVAPLQKVHLCDTVQVIYSALGVNVRKKVIRTLYNVLLDRYDELELGATAPTFADVVQEKLDSIIIRNDFVTPSKMDDAIAAATKMITGGAGGFLHISYANGYPSEILFTEFSDPSQYRVEGGVLRINKNGIGFSSRGTRGPYTQAWTIDGNFITQFIRAGRISSKNGNTYFDLDDSRIATEGYFTDVEGVTTLDAIELNRGRISFYRSKEVTAVITPSRSIISDNGEYGLAIAACGRTYTNKNGLVLGEYNPNSDKYLRRILIGGSHQGTYHTYDEKVIIFANTRILGRIYLFNDETKDIFLATSSPHLRVYLHPGFDADGDSYVKGELKATTFTQTSDERLKDIYSWDDRYDRIIDDINIVLYKWREDQGERKVHIGTVAQDVEKILDRLGIEDSAIVSKTDEYLGMNYTELSLLLIRRVQQQQKRIDDLEARLARLEALLNANT